MIAKLDQRVELQHVTYGRDAAGDATPGTATTYATVWASVLNGGGGEGSEGDQLVGRATFNVEIRRRSDVTPRDRIVWRGRTLEVVSIADGDFRSLTMVLSCTETRS